VVLNENGDRIKCGGAGLVQEMERRAIAPGFGFHHKAPEGAQRKNQTSFSSVLSVGSVVILPETLDRARIHDKQYVQHLFCSH
jgi:hypothetical protein